MNKKVCRNCKEEKSEKDFYKYISTDVCKDCLYEEWKKMGFKDLSLKYDFVYDDNLVQSLGIKTVDYKQYFQSYIRQISSLPQYKKENYKPKNKRTTLEFLEIEKGKLEDNLSKTLDKGDIGTYKNLIQAYERVLLLISNEENKSPTKNLYFDVDKDRKCTTVYFDNKIIGYNNMDYIEIARCIRDMCVGKDVRIYGDSRGLGMGLVDSLNAINVEIEDVIVSIYDTERPYPHTEVRRKINNKVLKQ